MDLELLNKLSKLTFCGFYDPSKKMVTVHFFNEQENKADIIAYLKSDMSWDVREITDEISVLEDDCEKVIIKHNRLGNQEKGSNFDKFVRVGLVEMAKQTHGENVDLEQRDKMFRILNNNTYKEN